MKRAFTMIELIFIIVIIGILAVIAIPKLSATKDDAKVAVELNNISNCIYDIGGSYTATLKETNDTKACRDITCAQIDLGDLTDGKINVTLKDSTNGPKYCDYVKPRAIKKGLNGEISFGGVKIYP